MEVNFSEVKAQVDCLPISYYAKRKIPLSVDKESNASFYNPVKDEISISYPQIAKGFKNVPDSEGEGYKETAIRGMVYHEISHAILTPTDLMCYARNNHGGLAAMNIFEDERIETLLSDFYMNVNFKKLVLYTNGGKITPPNNAMECFFNLVRFRVGDKDLLKTVEEIIERYNDMNGNERRWYRMEDYATEVGRLYKEVEKRWKKDGNTTPPQDFSDMEDAINETENSEGYSQNDVDGKRSESSNNQDEEGKGNGNNSNASEGESESEGNNKGEGEGEGSNEGEGEGEGKSEGENEGEGESKSNSSSKENSSNESGKEKAKQRLKGTHSAGAGKTDLELEKIFQSRVNRYIDTKVTETYKGIIDMFSKKNNSGNGCTGYSGIFNPRNIRNNDYKFFDRRVTAKGNNKFGKFHLNLFIDNSGSFEGLSEKANVIVRSLTEIEKKNPNFDFDLILCGDKLKDTKKEERFIRADEGTEADYDEVVQKMKEHSSKDAYTYNIVMYDGYCSYNHAKKNPFLGWDRNNVTVIDTGANHFQINEMKNARIVISSYNELVEKLTEQVANTLRIAFR